MREKLAGTGVALVTPFRENGAIDYDGLQRVVEHVSRGGVNYLVVMGTTGEAPTISADERKRVLAFIREHNAAQLPIVYGLGGNHTHEITEAIRQTDFSGVAAVLSVSPYYNKPSQAGILAHYSAIADASPVPVILYNVPGRTQSNVTAATTLKLAQHPNIIGTKEASGDLVQCAEIARSKPADFLLISGDDLLTVPLMALGAVGVISVLANAFPHPFTRMVNEARMGNYQAARQYLFKLLRINPLMYEESSPVGVKQALALLGVCQPYVRLPLAAASPSLAERIKRIVDEEQLANESVVL